MGPSTVWPGTGISLPQGEGKRNGRVWVAESGPNPRGCSGGGAPALGMTPPLGVDGGEAGRCERFRGPAEGYIGATAGAGCVRDHESRRPHPRHRWTEIDVSRRHTTETSTSAFGGGLNLTFWSGTAPKLQLHHLCAFVNPENLRCPISTLAARIFSDISRPFSNKTHMSLAPSGIIYRNVARGS